MKHYIAMANGFGEEWLMMKTITFIASENTNECKYLNQEIIHGYLETVKAIHEGKKQIYTTQMALLSTTLITYYGYKIFVVESNSRKIEIKLGDNDHTDRLIREGHNLFNLWTSGEFDGKVMR